MHAVILAAGEGTRLRPLTRTRPKPMLPVANRPILEYVVEAAADAGLEDVVLVVGYKRERIQNYFGDGDEWGVNISYAVQGKQLGTGHAVQQAAPLVDDTFVVLNGDRIIDSDIVSAVADQATPAPAVAVSRSDNPSAYGVVELDGNRVTSVAEKPPAHATKSDLINAGVYKFTSAVFDVLRSIDTVGELPVTAALQRLADDGSVRAVRHDGRWLDVSEPWDLLSMNAEILDANGGQFAETAAVHDGATVAGPIAAAADVHVHPNATVLAGTSLGDNAEIGANVVISNSVVLPDSTVAPGTVLRDCIVGSNATIGPNCTVEGGVTTVALAGELYESVRLGALVGDNTEIGGGVTFEPGTVVGNGAHVHVGATIDGSIEDDAVVWRG